MLSCVYVFTAGNDVRFKCYARNAGELLSERLINWIVQWPADPSFMPQHIHLTWFDWRSHINELCDGPHTDSP